MADTRGWGCGIYPLIVPSRFQDACDWHDRAYSENSYHQGALSREYVDRFFLRQMLLIAGRNPLRIAQAWAFYWIARRLGGLWWEGSR